MSIIKHGIDCTMSITKTLADTLVKAGYSFVCRYMVSSSMAWKRLTLEETKILSNAGLSILSVYESSANRASGGASAGTVDGKAALNEAKTLGMPITGCIYFAVDYDAGIDDFNTIEAYLKAAKVAIGNYKIGVYGSIKVIDEMFKRKVCDCYWQTYAWSNGKKSVNADVYQYENDTVVAGISCDKNYAYGNEGFWNLNKSTSISPKTWQEVIKGVSQSSNEWETAINLTMTAAKQANLNSLKIFQYFGQLILNVANMKYTTEMNWTKIIDTVSGNAEAWKTAVNAAVGAAEADGDLGDLEILKFLPTLIENIYKTNKLK